MSNASSNYFDKRPDITPTIYALELIGVESHKGYIKVGYTHRTTKERANEQLHTSGVRYRILHEESAMRSDGSCFMDKDVHKVLEKKGIRQLNSGYDHNEWYKCSIQDVRAAILEVKEERENVENRTENFPMRPEQEAAVAKTINYYNSAVMENPDKTPKFLWNCKMRFGKTFASYQLARHMKMSRVLVLTFKPAVEAAWRDDLLTHCDFEGWQFISNKDAKGKNINIDAAFEKANKRKPIVVFGSFQDLLGKNEFGGIKPKNEFIHAQNWDLVIFDEYHYGAWRENAQKLFQKENEEIEFDFEEYTKKEAANVINEDYIAITTKYYLFLSGTPFRSLNSGEFIEEQIYNLTYTDEQTAKANWKGSNNPYAALPQMIMLTYKMPDEITQVAKEGEFDEFDLNVFFSTIGNGDSARFKYEAEVQKWLDLIRGQYLPSSIDDLKLGRGKRPPMPFSDIALLNVLSHTLWMLPDVAACHAMKNLMKQPQNKFYHEDNYKIIVCAGTEAGIGLDALKPVQKAMDDPLKTKTITLTCGKLTTGVTVKPWTGIFMLRNLKSPETYFQAAFRVQSPWEIKLDDGSKQIMKHKCYVFDFALDRALRQVSDYSCQLNIHEGNPQVKVGEFIKFLPILAYDGSTMREINAEEVLDIAMSGTSATLLAKRWESALLVNVDNLTLKALQNNQEALDALMKIEGFRSLNSDIETIIAKTDAIKKARKTPKDDKSSLPPKVIDEEEKKLKSLRKQIQEKLIKFATRIPVFMYLTDYREYCLKDVITQIEPDLFKFVTGLNVRDFELLCSIGVFNASLMNDAIYKFKRYEDSSLSYTGIDKATSNYVGGYDTVIPRDEYKRIFYGRQAHEEPEKPIYKVGLRVSNPENGKGKISSVGRDYIYVDFSNGKKRKFPITTKHIKVD